MLQFDGRSRARLGFFGNIDPMLKKCGHVGYKHDASTLYTFSRGLIGFIEDMIRRQNRLTPKERKHFDKFASYFNCVLLFPSGFMSKIFRKTLSFTNIVEQRGEVLRTERESFFTLRPCWCTCILETNPNCV